MDERSVFLAIWHHVRAHGAQERPGDGPRLGGIWSTEIARLGEVSAWLCDDGASRRLQAPGLDVWERYDGALRYDRGTADKLRELAARLSFPVPSQEKRLKVVGTPRVGNGVRIVAEVPGPSPGMVREQVFADIYGTADAEVEENGRRMTACWNALQGIPTSDLEEGRVVVMAIPVDIANALLLPSSMEHYRAESWLRMHLRHALSRLQHQTGQQGGDERC